MHSRSWISTVLLCFVALLLLAVRLDRPAPVHAQVVNPFDPHLGPCPIFSTKNVWNTAIDTRPVNAHSNDYVNRIGSSSSLHPNFGSDPTNGIPITFIAPDTHVTTRLSCGR
jgi:hypothetical protein